jgi:ligand-binding sensor domain-containing protein
MAMLLLLLSACERNNYDLLDPSSAGVMTLYTTLDGLPGNEVRDIKLDSKNNLWFTFPGHGTARFNGTNWTTYSESPSQLLSNAVTVLDETSNGTIVIGTSDGLSILSPSNVWSSYTEPVAGMDVSAIKVASNGWVWVGTQSQGFFLNTGSGFVKTVSNRYSNVNTIEEGSAGNIFIGTDSGIIKWNGTDYSYIKRADGLPAEKVSALRFDSRNRLWIGTEGGKTAAWMDQQGIHQLDLMAGSDNLSIKDIHEDRKGDIWFATAGNGVIRYDGIIPYSFKEYDGFPENNINCIGEDKDGNLWFGLASRGVVKYTLPIRTK